MKLVFDIECNGLTPDTIWCIVAYNIDTDTMYTFSDHATYHGTIADGVRMLENAELLIAHNGIGFDARVLDNMFGTDLLSKRFHDTFVMSQVLSYKRSHRHGLAGWGEHLGNKKWEFDKWDEFSREMVKYCQQDVKVNYGVYKALLAEYSKIYAVNPLIKEGLKVEHDVAVFNAKVRHDGWKLDTVKADATLKLMLARMEEINSIMLPKLGMKTVWIDKEPRSPKYKNNGDFNHHTVKQLAEYLGHEVKSSDTHLIQPTATFQRSRQEQIELGSTELVKGWLLENGWKPDEYQKKKVGFEWVTMGPKLTSTSLAAFGPEGLLIDEFYTLRARKAVIEGWLTKQVDGRIHGNMWTCGTPTFRCRHEVIVNLPGSDAIWGREIRELLAADDGTVIVGADSSGNQLRGLCHYVRNAEFTKEVIFGDQHQRNADSLGCSRAIAKSYLYAYLFGAGDAKLGQVLTGKANASVGKKSRADFAKGIKGLSELKDKLSKVWKNTRFGGGEGKIPGLDGRPIYVASDHQALNYLLQSAEGITCKAAVSYAMAKIKEEGIDAEGRIFYHDEIAYQCKPEDAERVGQILQEAFAEAPKWFGVVCMDGGAPCVGSSYADVH